MIESIQRGFDHSNVSREISLDKLVDDYKNNIVSEETRSLVQKHIVDSSKRYRFSPSNPTTELISWIFRQSFNQNSDEIISIAENLTGDRLYPLWKRCCWIKLPQAINFLVSNELTRIAICISALVLTMMGIYRSYYKIAFLVAAKGVPFIINNTPLKIISLGNKILEAKDFFNKNRLEILLATLALNYMIPGRASYLLHHTLFAVPQTLLEFAVNTSVQICVGTWRTCGRVGYSFQKISNNAEKERLTICQQKCLEIWLKQVSR